MITPESCSPLIKTVMDVVLLCVFVLLVVHARDGSLEAPQALSHARAHTSSLGHTRDQGFGSLSRFCHTRDRPPCFQVLFCFVFLFCTYVICYIYVYMLMCSVC